MLLYFTFIIKQLLIFIFKLKRLLKKVPLSLYNNIISKLKFINTLTIINLII
jgi:hypothetical protein